MENHERSRRNAFTLVELLVVIGIIVVLIGILLPVFSRAHDTAKRVKCMANLRAQGQALLTYVMQTDHYPGASEQLSYGIWPTRLRAVLGGDQQVFYCPSRDPSYEWTPAIYQSTPFPPGDPGFGYRQNEPALYGVPFSYGYNGMGTDVFIGSPWGQRGLGGSIPSKSHPNGGSNTMSERRASAVRNTADMIAIADSGPFVNDSSGVSNCMMIWPVPKASHHYEFGPPAAVHAGGANVLFCDGHVEWFPADDLIIHDIAALKQHITPASDRDQALARKWNYDHKP